mmetsp:Transcript_75326/g.135704  ORF Transcript_75326/g.135704 Transcript_75326/m.135704 type:complete len:550 (-) Transcript_75326:37-1686(-)
MPHSGPKGRRRRQVPVPPAREASSSMGEGGGGSSSSSSRFPERCWARKMCQQLHKELLESSQGPTGLGCRPLRFGTDCAGAEAPWFALRDISRELSQQLGVAMSVDHLFACDIEWACRHFISRNSRPAALFCDLLARDRISQCVRAERPRLVPSGLDIYVAGFPCKDFSMLNRNRPCLEGPHASIFYGVVQYITRHEPAVFILENVSGLLMERKGEEAPIHEVMATLRNIPHYQVRGWKVNSMDYYLPQNRTRVYIVGVHTQKASLRRPLEKWGDKIKSMKSSPKESAHAYMLDDDQPEVQAEYMRLLERMPSASAERKPLEGSFNAHSSERQHLPGAPKAASSGDGRVPLPSESQLGGGRRGTRWLAKHRLFRAKLGVKRDAKPVVCKGSDWSRFLSVRSQDCLELIAAKLQRQGDFGKTSHEQSEIITEISRGYSYSSSMFRISPCATPNCRLWVYNRGRWMIGREKLALQGFPVDELDLTGLTESNVELLAGNAMSVTMVGLFLYLVLAYVGFPAEAPDAGRTVERGPSKRSQPKVGPVRSAVDLG